MREWRGDSGWNLVGYQNKAFIQKPRGAAEGYQAGMRRNPFSVVCSDLGGWGKDRRGCFRYRGWGWGKRVRGPSQRTPGWTGARCRR